MRGDISKQGLNKMLQAGSGDGETEGRHEGGMAATAGGDGEVRAMTTE